MNPYISAIFSLETVGGLNVVESPLLPLLKPNMELSKETMVSDEFRKKFDEWLIDFFGSDIPMYQTGNLLVVPQGVAKLLKGRKEFNEIQ